MIDIDDAVSLTSSDKDYFLENQESKLPTLERKSNSDPIHEIVPYSPTKTIEEGHEIMKILRSGGVKRIEENESETNINEAKNELTKTYKVIFDYKMVQEMEEQLQAPKGILSIKNYEETQLEDVVDRLQETRLML